MQKTACVSSDQPHEAAPGWVWWCDAAISRYHNNIKCLFARFFTYSQNIKMASVTQDPRKGALLPLHGKEREWPPDHKERERPPNNQGARRVGGRGRQSTFVCVVVSGFLGLGRKMGQEDPRTGTQDPRTRVEHWSGVHIQKWACGGVFCYLGS